MASPKDKRRQDLAKLLKAHADLGAPDADAAEQAMWVILARHGTKEGATRAYNALWRRFVNPNECRVAKASEIAAIIRSGVKNEAIRVAEIIRGFLRRFHKDQHTMDYGRTESMTNEQLKKYLAGIESHMREVALALFCHYALRERAWQEAVETDEKPKKRGEREVMQLLDRLRLLCSVSVLGAIVAKTKQVNVHRQLGKAWAYAPLPPEPAPPKPAKTAKKAPEKAPAKPVAKKAAKKTAKKAAGKKKAAESTRGGGTARPRTSRTARSRAAVKKSSRR